MDHRTYLLLWFAAAFFLVLLVWGLYSHYHTAPPPIAPSTQSAEHETLVDRLRAERERRIHERSTTSTSPFVQ